MNPLQIVIRSGYFILLALIVYCNGCGNSSSQDGANLFRGEIPPGFTPRENVKSHSEVADAVSRGLKGGFENKGSWRQYFFIIMSFLFFGVVIGFLVYLDRRHRHPFADDQDSPMSLFYALANVHELTKMEQKFLQDAASELGLDHPLLFFVEPNFFYLIQERRESAADQEMIQIFLRKLFGIESSLELSDIRLSTAVSQETVLVSQSAVSMAK